MTVKIKDRKQEIEYLRLILSMCEVGASYEVCDLIMLAQKAIKERGGNFNLEDAVKLHKSWKERWEEYFKNLKKEENESTNQNNA